MSGEEKRHEWTVEGVEALTKRLMSLLDRKKPKESQGGSHGKLIEIPDPVVSREPARPRTRLQRILGATPRSNVLPMGEVRDSTLIQMAKKRGRILRPADVAKVRNSAGADGDANQILSYMDQNGLFDS